MASIWRLWPEQQRSIAYDLSYSHPDHGVTLHFSPTDFMQVNLPVNRLLVSQAMAWLALKPQDHVLDLFSGVGNLGTQEKLNLTAILLSILV